MQRLKDIIDEVEKQLRSVKLQASKAQRYQEYSERLKELRVGLGLQEYHELTERLTVETAALDKLRTGLDEQSAQVTAWEAEARRLEQELERLDAAVHQQEGASAAARQQIAAEESTLARESNVSTDLETDVAGIRRRLTELNTRVAALSEAASSAAQELASVEEQCLEQRRGVHAREDELQHAILRLRLLQTQVQSDKTAHLEQMRRAAHLQNEAVASKANEKGSARTPMPPLNPASEPRPGGRILASPSLTKVRPLPAVG